MQDFAWDCGKFEPEWISRVKYFADLRMIMNELSLADKQKYLSQLDYVYCTDKYPDYKEFVNSLKILLG